MKTRRRRVTRSSKEDEASRFAEFIIKDGTMRTLLAIAGVLVGVMATHLDLGRKVDTLGVQINTLAARVESVEKGMDRRDAVKK